VCCLLASLFMLGPRAAILVWWLLQPVRWSAAFDNSFLWPFVGFLVAPWTTLMYVAVAPAGITGFDYIWLGAGVAMDLFTWFGGGYSNRSRMPTTGA
jgi:hypothetical protein